MAIQVSPELQFDACEVESIDANYIIDGTKLEEFIRQSTAHSAVCGNQLLLVDRCTNQGCYLKETWMCPCCGKKLFLENCDIVKTEAVAQGARYSRGQADFNIRMLKAAILTGINLTQLVEFLEGHMGVKISNYRNLRKQGTKVRESIKSVFEKRKIENKREHVEATRAKNSDNVIVWEKDGKVHRTCTGDISHDGAGCTRVYNHKHRGKQTAFIVNSMDIKKPLELVVSQVSCAVMIFCANISYSCLSILFQLA